MRRRLALARRIDARIAQIHFALVIRGNPQAHRGRLRRIRLQRILRRTHRHQIIEDPRRNVFLVKTFAFVPIPDKRHVVFHVVADRSVPIIKLLRQLIEQAGGIERLWIARAHLRQRHRSRRFNRLRRVFAIGQPREIRHLILVADALKDADHRHQRLLVLLHLRARHQRVQDRSAQLRERAPNGRVIIFLRSVAQVIDHERHRRLTRLPEILQPGEVAALVHAQALDLALDEGHIQTMLFIRIAQHLLQTG